jgi:hypothetical protein
MNLETAQYQYQTGTIQLRPGMWCRVGVLEAKREYGRLRFLVSPISGTGEAWVNAESVTLDILPSCEVRP